MGPSGTVTFLFTDVEGSTALWAADREAMAFAVERHDEILRSTIEGRGGYVFTTAGDSFAAAFSRAGDAVGAALEAQDLLMAEPWPEQAVIRVRMGLHTGEAQERDGDYFGPVVNTAARIMSAGHGGQVLTSSVTRELVGDMEAVDLGQRRLRDLGRPIQLFQVGGEISEFAALRTLDAVEGNLPSQATSFVGRAAEVRELVSLVRDHQLVTLTGVGGVGKTRLAVQVAAEIAPRFADGVWVVELAAVDDPAAVPDAVASVLGVIQQAGMSVLESVAAAAPGREMLIVLDNCEHVLDAAADLVEAIIDKTDSVYVLATSREGLRVGGEHLWPVPSLDVRAGAGSEAVELFVERAQAVMPAFDISSNEETVSEICGRLDGIALAIELAAARMVSMSPSEVRDRLDDRFRLLSGSRRGLERHQTLRQAVQWSYELLEAPERDILDRCSVFAGGFDLNAAVSVAGGGADEFEVLDLLDSLVRKSLVTADRSENGTRYGLLETIRQFAEEQLAATGAADDVRDSHARQYADTLHAMPDAWFSPDQSRTIRWVELEMDNPRSAFGWAHVRADLETAARIAIGCALSVHFLQSFEPTNWSETLLEHADIGELSTLPDLHLSATMTCHLGRGDDAVRHGETGLALASDERYEDPVGLTHAMLAMALLFSGQSARAAEHMRLEIEVSGDSSGFLRAMLAHCLTFGGNGGEALSIANEAVEAAGDLSVPGALCYAFYSKSRVETDPVLALDAARQAALVIQNDRLVLFEMNSASWLGMLEGAHGDSLEGLKSIEQALEFYNRSGATYNLCQNVGYLSLVALRAELYGKAAELYGVAQGSPMAAGMQVFIDAVVELKEALGLEAYERLSEQGAAMPLPDAVNLARELIHRIREQLDPAT